MKLKLNSAFSICLLTGLIGSVRAQTAPTNSGWGAGRHILLVGGGMYHDYPKWFDETDSATLRAAGFAVRYTTNADLATKWLGEADVLVFAAGVKWDATASFKSAYAKHRASGKGIVGLHSGLWINWNDWPDHNRGFGLAASSHPPVGEFTVLKLIFDHPLSAAIPDHLTLMDELYHVQPFPNGVPVKVIAETSNSPKTNQKHPSFWVVDEPGVRVACIAPGHDGRTHTNEFFKKWLVDTVQWAVQPASVKTK
jgi:type 1 glutamine amidotransferase